MRSFRGESIRPEKVALGLAFLAGVVSFVAWRPSESSEAGDGPLAASGFERGVKPATGSNFRAAPPPELWPEPRAQSAGDVWRFDLFTPPALQRRRSDGAVAVVPDRNETGPAAGIRLQRVSRVPFPLQLAGFIGAADSPHAVVLQEGGHRPELVRAGHLWPERRLRLEGFRSTGLIRPAGGSAELARHVGIAVLRDLQTQEIVELSTGEKTLTGELQAELRLAERKSPLTVREGDIVRAGRAVYRVQAIRHQPPEVVLLPTEAEDRAGQLTLRPVAAASEARRAATPEHDPAHP